MEKGTVPESRLRVASDRPLRPDGTHVLYWMVTARRTGHNFGLQHAVESAAALRRPLIVMEALRCDHPWASDRFHRFVLDGMRDNADALARSPVRYHPYVEPEPGADRGLLAELARTACLVVTDEAVGPFVAALVAGAAGRLPARLEVVDSNGLLPLSASAGMLPTAHAFRRHLQRELPAHLRDAPAPDPVARADLPRARLSRDVLRRWPPATARMLSGGAGALGELPLDHGVAPAPAAGGARQGRSRLAAFLRSLSAYAHDRNHPDADATSGLSPYLHFGHVSVHDAFGRVARREGWSVDRLSPRRDGRRSGWWGMSTAAEAFLDELVTWRELGHGRAFQDPQCHRYDTLPGWAQRTLADHEGDERPHAYSREELAGARTHDEIWNACQRQLVSEGRLHGYLRMLWGKKILEWSPTPREALEVMFALNDRHALDGRDPNSISGICWVLGRYDRAWGPERPIFGKVRYMSSENTRRKLRLSAYLARHAAGG